MSRVERMKREDVQSTGQVIPSWWERGMKGKDEREKRRWKGVRVVILEVEGEEEGVMDGMVGMINNPLIRDGFYFDQDVFGDKDIGWRHSLKKLCTFLG